MHQRYLECWQIFFLFIIIIIIIIIIIQLYYQFLTILHRVFNQDLAWEKLVILFILCFIHTFRFYFSYHIDNTLLMRWAVLQSGFFVFHIDCGARYYVNVFICPFLDPAQSFHYYKHGGIFKVPRFLCFYFLFYLYLSYWAYCCCHSSWLKPWYVIASNCECHIQWSAEMLQCGLDHV